MDAFGSVIAAGWNALGIPMTIFGFTFSFQNVLVFLIIASFVIGAIVYLFRS